MYGLETGVKERSAGTQKKIVKAAVAETPVRPEAQFDGEWKGKFVVVIDNEGGDLCGFRGKYFDATVKDNEFVAIINQEGNKEKIRRGYWQGRNIGYLGNLAH